MTWHGKHYLEGCSAPPHVKYLLLTLAEYADREGWCNPSLTRLAAVMELTQRTVQRSRALAVDLGLLAYKPGKWKGHGGEYLLLKGDASAALTDAQRVTLDASKGWRYRRSKGDASVHRTSKKFQEHARGRRLEAPGPRATERGATVPTLTVVPEPNDSRNGNADPLTRRRELARVIREAPTDDLRHRYLATFGKEYGHLYGRATA